MLQVSTEVQSSFALFDRIFEYLDLQHEITDAPDAEPLRRRRAARWTLDHVRFHYDVPEEIPEEGEPTVASGRSTTCRSTSRRASSPRSSGPSGAGKTTITYLVPRIYDVNEGAVRIDGRDVRGLTLASIADAIGIVTQETYLFHDTIRRNLLYGARTRPRRSWRRRRGPPTSTTGSPSCPRATTRSWGSAATSSRAARSSGSRSRA